MIEMTTNTSPNSTLFLGGKSNQSMFPGLYGNKRKTFGKTKYLNKKCERKSRGCLAFFL